MTHLLTQILQARIPILPLPALLLMPIREEIQQVNSLDHLTEHGTVSLCRRDGEPARAARNPYPDFSIVMLTVGVVGDVLDDDALR